MYVLYLHGFGSGPLSKKAVILREALEKKGVPVDVPNISLPDFEHMRVSLMVGRALELLSGRGPAVVVGSSLGALVALHAAGAASNVSALVLLAPALSPDERWKLWIGPEGLERWKREGTRPFFNHVTGKDGPIDFGFYLDLVELAKPPAPRVPVRIVHGRRDEAVPFEVSEAFAKAHPSLVRLTLVDDDHSLLAHTDLIEREVEAAMADVRTTS